MKYRVLVLLLVAMLYSCGSAKRKKTATTTKPKRETTVQTKKEETEELEATSKVRVVPATVSEYIAYFKETAKANMINYKIPASITLAQGILESGAGKGRLCLEANNHFGIKCHKGWEGDYITHDDDAAQECFRKYDDPADSYRDHSLFLSSRSRYEDLFKLDILDYKAWAKGLKNAGYATDPKYPNKLIAIIERYNLNDYDEEVVNGKPKKKTTKIEQKRDTTKSYVVQKGDTLYAISKRFSISIDKIKKINNLSDNSISVGQKLNLE